MGTIKSINLNAGHNAAGKVACGAVGFNRYILRLYSY